MNFGNTFCISLDLLLKFDKDFKRDFETMEAKIPKQIKQQCALGEYVDEEVEDVAYKQDIFDGKTEENSELEFSVENYQDTTRYLLDVSALTYEDITQIPQKKVAEYEEGDFCYEMASFIHFGEDGCSDWEYTFEVFNLEDGYHVVMTKHEDDKTEEHKLIETRRVDKKVDLYSLVTFINSNIIN